MRRLPALSALLPALLLVVGLAACDSLDADDSSGTVSLSGQVLDDATNNPVPGAFVRIAPYGLFYETDDEGRFDVEVGIDSTMQLVVTSSKDGFSTARTEVLALAGRVIDVPTLRLRRTVEEEAQSGRASNILLLQQSGEVIGVRESGSKEVAQITFQVADSLGRPVVLDQAADVRFSFGAHPGGGEFLFPSVVRTDNNGQAVVNLSSGTRAGVVQIVAEASVDGRTLRSLPVAVSIHGGLPDATHFTVAPAQYNFPGLLRYGITNGISVIVGDRHANPVKPGTVVYFTSSHGVIEGSTSTNAQGRGGVSLISANPLPADGIALVTATTADENRAQVSTSIPVVFSGAPTISVTPAVARLDETYSLVVTDGNGNPLAENTQVQVRVEGTKVKAVGHTSVRLPDTAFNGGTGYEHVVRGPGITTFSFRSVEDTEVDETGDPTVASIKITVSGPNGTLEAVLLPGAGAAPGGTVVSRTRNAVVTPLPGGGARVALEVEG